MKSQISIILKIIKLEKKKSTLSFFTLKFLSYLFLDVILCSDFTYNFLKNDVFCFPGSSFLVPVYSMINSIFFVAYMHVNLFNFQLALFLLLEVFYQELILFKSCFIFGVFHFVYLIPV